MNVTFVQILIFVNQLCKKLLIERVPGIISTEFCSILQSKMSNLLRTSFVVETNSCMHNGKNLEYL